MVLPAQWQRPVLSKNFVLHLIYTLRAQLNERFALPMKGAFIARIHAMLH
jgi:hypothetical protein